MTKTETEKPQFIRYRGPFVNNRGVALYRDADGRTFEVAELVLSAAPVSDRRFVDAEAADETLSASDVVRVLRELGA